MSGSLSDAGSCRGALPGLMDLSIVMPCLNEERTVGLCVGKAQRYLDANGIRGEVIVADNGSTDRSREIAVESGARVVEVAEKGYGAALKGGFSAARGEFIVMGDADGSYDFSDLGSFVNELRGGCDMVIGNRFSGGIASGAMPFLHRYLGNPLLSALGRILFPTKIRDFHCGLRGIRKTAVERMNLRTTGMEFASEMVIRASLLNMKVKEVPTTLLPDGGGRSSHLRAWRDGWRHLMFISGSFLQKILGSPHD